jgi:aldehyde dehydrogenase (NAD+)
VAGSRIVLGDPADDTTTMGPLVSREQYDRVVGYLKSGAEEAELVFGGRHGPELVPELPGGHWVDSRYHLASGVWTRDLARAHRFVRDLYAGNVWVNAYRQTRYELPFSGVKDSGYGHDAVLEFTREKAAVIKA